MKKFAIGILCLGMLGASAFAQTERTTRPRVAATPAPATPTIKNDGPVNSTGRRPPVLSGGNTTSAPATSATPPAVGEEDEVIRVQTNLITMPVSVVDRDGRFISGLTQRDFQIFENGAEQKIEYFQSVEQPFTVVLLIDVSPSTQYQIDEIHDSAIAFVNQLRPADKVMVIAFDERVRVLSHPTSNKKQLQQAIYEAQFGDGTSLYEAVDHVINRELRNIEGRKAVVLFTDGVDTTSRRANYQSTIADVEEVDALFYPIRYNTSRDNFGGGGGWGRGGGRRGGGGGAMGGGDLDDLIGIILGGNLPRGGGNIPMGRGPAGTNQNEYERGREYLETLAQNSGGRKYEADTLNNLEAAFAGIAEELRRQYSLGYYPENAGQIGDRKQIRIRVSRPNLIVKAKTTYIVGQGNGVAGR